MIHRARSLLRLMLLLAPGTAFRLWSGEPGTVDTTFDPGIGIGTDYHANARCFAEQPDGRIIFGGYFQTYRGAGPSYLGRAMPDGARDALFSPSVIGIVECITLQPDGKILIGGQFITVSGVTRRRIARLNGDGTLDATFNPGSGANSTVASIVLQDDGKLVIGGFFTSYNEVDCRGIVRLESDGSIDSSFNVAIEPLDWLGRAGVDKLVAQADGRIFVTGSFGTVNGLARTNLVRLHPDGSVDAGFDPGRGPFVDPRILAIQADGRPVIADSFYSIIRLNTDGSPDTAFNAGRGELTVEPWLDALAIQSDGRIVVAGYFTQIDGFPRNRLARLNSDGTFDWSFHPGTGAENSIIGSPSVLAVYMDRNDRLLIGGTFATIHGMSRRGIARLFGGEMSPGPPSITTQPASQALRRYQPLEMRVDASSYETPAIEWRRNDVTISGASNRVFKIEFTQFSDAGDYTVVLNNRAGAVTSIVAVVTIDPVATGPGALDVGYHPDAAGGVYQMKVDADDRVLVGTSWGLHRLNRDGSLDPTFSIGGPIVGLDGQFVSAVAIQPDGKLVVGGFFVEFGGQVRENITRLEPDGATDVAFAPQPGPSHAVDDLALDEDGKVVVVGGFWHVNGRERRCVARLNADGSLDDTFNIGTGAYYSVRAVARQPDGKFIIGGDFTSFNEVASGRIARLNTDGSVDAGFTTGAGANATVSSLLLQPDGKILVGGRFTDFAGTPRFGLARLHSHGTLDASFAPVAKLQVWAMALQPDGKLIVGGSFATDTIPIHKDLLRLNADGSVDESFAPGFWTDGGISAIGLQSDGRVIIGGGFKTVNGYPRSYLARLEGDRFVQAEPPRFRTYARRPIGGLQLQFSGAAGTTYRVLASPNLADWGAIGIAQETGPGLFEFIDADPAHSSRFYRVRAE